MRADRSGETVTSTIAAANGHQPKRALSVAEVRQRQEAALNHGLYVKSTRGRGVRKYRAGRLLHRLQIVLAEEGRPLTALQLPLARAWCQYELLAVDAYTALQRGEGGDKGLEHYRGLRRDQLAYSAALGLTLAAAGQLARDLNALTTPGERETGLGRTPASLREGRRMRTPWSQARIKRAIAGSKICAFSREVGLTLTRGQAEVAAEFEVSGAQTMVLQAGRRGGKSTIEDLLATYDACVRDHLRQYMRPGELRVAAIICPRIEQAAEHIRNCRSLIDQSWRLRSMVVSETESEIRLNNYGAIRAYPCSARGIRGAAWSSVMLDEFAHFVTVDAGNAAGDRILEAALPALSQFGKEG